MKDKLYILDPATVFGRMKFNYACKPKGTREIGLAVTASTLTIVAVFIPVAFMGGAVGQFFH